MASILPYGKRWRAHVYVSGARESQVFRTRGEARDWATRRELELGERREGKVPTFAQAAEEWLGWKLPQLTNAENQRTVEQSVRDYAIPKLGPMRLDEIRRRDLVEVVQAIQKVNGGAGHPRIETAHRVGRRIREIFDRAADLGHIEEGHPAARLSRVLPGVTKRPRAAIEPHELPDLLKAIDAYPEPVTRLGLLLMANTFLRTSELSGARWEELVRADAVWVVPAERMKGKLGKRRPHVVPLSPQVQGMLGELRALNEDSPYILASPFNRETSISKNTMLFALYRLGYRGRMTGHGFRAVASTILNESKLWSRDAIERQLAHRETDEVREAYHRAEYLPERREMMRWWSTYLAERAASTAS